MFGCHINGDFFEDIINIHKDGGTLIQCFITDPIGKKTLKLSDSEINKIKNHLIKYNISMIIHAPYILNFAREFKIKSNINTRESWWIKTILTELEYASKIGAKGSVIHFGKYLHLDKHIAITNMVESLKYVIQSMNKVYISKNVFIYLETSCGQGSELGYTIEEFSTIYNSFTEDDKERIKICIDTCHIFVAGYDIRTPEGFNNFIIKFDKLIGTKYIKLIHLNDSNKPVESHVDRHDTIGDGFIGLKGLQYIYKWAQREGIDIILETGGSFIKEKKLLDDMI
jgi:apurinic endonuclease APN1